MSQSGANTDECIDLSGLAPAALELVLRHVPPARVHTLRADNSAQLREQYRRVRSRQWRKPLVCDTVYTVTLDDLLSAEFTEADRGAHIEQLVVRVDDEFLEEFSGLHYTYNTESALETALFRANMGGVVVDEIVRCGDVEPDMEALEQRGIIAE